MVRILGQQHSIFNQYLAEIRDEQVQKDSLRFRYNLERIGALFAHRISEFLEYETREIESSIIDAQGACLAASQTAVRYKDRILPRSESAASTMQKTYQLGEASLLEVIDARRVLVDTRRQYLAALLQAQLECSRLNALAGTEDE